VLLLWLAALAAEIVAVLVGHLLRHCDVLRDAFEQLLIELLVHHLCARLIGGRGGGIQRIADDAMACPLRVSRCVAVTERLGSFTYRSMIDAREFDAFDP